ncbi:hypothetical protein [Streptomyces sp. NPDC006638]|uniref:hypothetical protein n=1 Tax=Streptomyces sp. NPDC006638 TaxID=3157183 RepID=UPI0033AD7BBD
MLDHFFGPAPGRHVVGQHLVGLLAHRRDLSSALGRDVELDISVPHSAVQKIYEDLPRTAGGSFAAGQSAPEPARLTDNARAAASGPVPRSRA